MKIILTPSQAADLSFEVNKDFIRAAFYTGHSLIYIKELVSSPVYEKERNTIVALAYNLGMSSADTVGIQ